MRILVIYISLSLFYCNKNNDKEITFGEVLVYNYCIEKGYTNSEAYNKIINLKEQKLPVTKIQNIDSINILISNSKQKKLFPGKLGKELLFMKVVKNEGEVIDVVLTPNLIRCYTCNMDYWIKNEKDIQWLREFINKINKKFDC